MMEALDSFGAAWSAGLLRAALQGGAAILLVWAALRMLPRVPPRIRCWFWRLAYLKLLIALCWATPVDLPLLPPPAPAPASEAVRLMAPHPAGEVAGLGEAVSPAGTIPSAAGRPAIRWPSPVAAL